MLKLVGLPRSTQRLLLDTVLRHANTHDYTVWQVLLHGSLVTGTYNDRYSDIDIAILTDGRDGGQHCIGQLRKFDDTINAVWIRADTCYRLRRYPLGFEARLLMTGKVLYQAKLQPSFPSISYAAARDEIVETCFEQAANLAIRARNDLQYNMRYACPERDVCYTAYTAAVWALKGALTAREIDYRPKSVRWNVERLLQMLAWESPAHNRLLRFAALLPESYYRTPEELETEAPSIYPLRTSRIALFAAWMIMRGLAPPKVIAYLRRYIHATRPLKL